MIALSRLTKTFGGLVAVPDVSFRAGKLISHFFVKLVRELV